MGRRGERERKAKVKHGQERRKREEGQGDVHSVKRVNVIFHGQTLN